MGAAVTNPSSYVHDAFILKFDIYFVRALFSCFPFVHSPFLAVCSGTEVTDDVSLTCNYVKLMCKSVVTFPLCG